MPTVPTIDVKPFYAYVGAGDAALESLRTAVTTLPEQLKTVPEQLKTVPASLKAARTQLPAQVKDLQGQFAGRGQDQHLRLGCFKTDALATSAGCLRFLRRGTAGRGRFGVSEFVQGGQHECRRLARAGLGTSDNDATREDDRDGLLLNGCRLVKTQLLAPVRQHGLQAKIFKTHLLFSNFSLDRRPAL